ncbi:hypothetical protein ACJQWK_09509 [Exserohilum turcicum]|uniref:Uncharacterized protein n=1 Tax=Exserohilum turcicum (strain 28A) TaxID=671987 RepID=R0KJA3_EXST2|nr:uncharacterized protein SETTUDRAFT_105769 [Exserohilum turcica Et28A]EOA89249.1 hypothetical protein SETTUDRAFT_105769 [Exserohilum turcica Et28A]
MSRNAYSAFQKHLLFFSTPTTPPRLTLGSVLRAAVSLGLDVPVAVLLSVSLRLLYAPLPYFWSPIIVDRIPVSSHRTQLESTRLLPEKTEYTCSDLLALLKQSEKQESAKGWLAHMIDQGHIIGFWTMAANTQTHTVSKHDVERFQQGNWEEAVVERRAGRHEVLPLWRGGPIWVGGHSWAVRKLFGVKVYNAKGQ